jgi:signal transduction histidine kinase
MSEDDQRRLMLAFHSLKSDLATITEVLSGCSAFWIEDLSASGTVPLREEDVAKSFLQAGVILVNVMDKFVEKFSVDYSGRGITDELWNAVLTSRNTLRLIIESTPVEEAPFELRQEAVSLIRIVNCCQQGAPALHRETVRNVRYAAQRIKALGCLCDLRRAEERLTDARRRIVESIEPNRNLTVNPIADGVEFDAVIGDLVRKHSALGDPERIAFRLEARCPGLRLRTSAEELATALGDLFLNALKYSDKLAIPDRSWITVKTNRRGPDIELSIENWGKAINSQELESGLIYEYGYRGEHVRDSEIPGSGIGLFRSREAIEKLGGELIIQCRYYGARCVTTATARLPRDRTAVATVLTSRGEVSPNNPPRLS